MLLEMGDQVKVFMAPFGGATGIISYVDPDRILCYELTIDGGFGSELYAEGELVPL